MAVEVGVRLLAPAQLDQHDRAPGARLGQEVQVAEPLGDRHELVGDLEPALLLARPPVRVLGGRQRVGQRLQVVDAARHVDRLARPARAAAPRSRPSSRAPRRAARARARAAASPRRAASSSASSSSATLAVSSVPNRSQALPAWPSAALANSVTASALRAAAAERRVGVARLLPAAGQPQRAGELAQQPRALGLVDRLVALAGGQRGARQVDDLVVGQPRLGLLGGAQRVGDRALDLLGPGGGEVAGELGQVRVDRVAVARLDRLADPAVEARAAGRGQVVLERLAQQRVGERVAPGRRRSPPRGCPRARRRRACRAARPRRCSTTRSSTGQLEVAADQRRDLEHALGALGQAADRGSG